MRDRPTEILLVEDNPGDVELTLHAFRRNNLANRVHVVRDGEEALDFLFRRGPYTARGPSEPKFVLLDLKLPKVDGIEVLRAIRDDPRLAAIPVVVMTSSREQRDLEKAYGLGVNSYIVKPIEFEAFIETATELGFYWAMLNERPAWSEADAR